MYGIEFEDGAVTCGDSRANALVMAADLRALIDDRHPDAYTARWRGPGRIEVAVRPPLRHVWAR